MFEDTPDRTARVFAMPMGTDFAAALVDGLRARMKGQPPEALARMQLYVNTSRMQRRIRQLLTDGGALLLPQVRLVTDLARDQTIDLPPPVDGLARRLQLAQLVRALIESDPSLAARDAAYDLADSLAALLEEMQGEGVSAETIAGLDVANHSAHWLRSQKFIALVQDFLGGDAPLDTEGRQRAVVDALAARWRDAPPGHPIIVAGSTGSRGTTRAFMRAVAGLPQGALVLPGFDTDMPTHIWDRLAGKDTHGAEDHPQFRYKTLTSELGISPSDIRPWTTAAPHSAARNALVSLALRPAPITDAWLEEGPDLADIAGATKDITLIEAPSPRAEVISIALRLREAAEDGTTAALITPDQTLARQVSAALSAWQIVPNDSAGARLDLSPPGRLLRQTAALIGQAVSPDALLALLKHPLIYADQRRDHLARTRALEIEFLRGGPAILTRDLTQEWAEKRIPEDAGVQAWHDWLWDCIAPLSQMQTDDLTRLIPTHLTQTQRLTEGPEGGTAHLWLKAAGEEVAKLARSLEDAAPVAGRYSPAEYADLIATLLAKEEVREPFHTHPDIMIWGTLEARVQGADLVILAGLNDGTWPALPDPDPWLNRDMRRRAGLRLPEARIGLSAHDFQQGIAARKVWLTRATRDAEAETVPSRWLNRIGNLLQGLDGEGQSSFAAMRARGDVWLKMAAAYDRPRFTLEPARRPAPQPPATSRPKDLWVTHIETLIRDPYAIYARHILDLRPLKPLHAQADAALRGDIIHKILQAFVAEHMTALPQNADTLLAEMAQRFFDKHIAWPATRTLWMSKFARAIPWFIQTERARRALATPNALEVDGKRTSAELGVTLYGRADRVDSDAAGGLVIYDYKTGTLPNQNIRTHFNKQLPLLACIGTVSGYEGFPSRHVVQASYIGLGAKPGEVDVTADPQELAETWTQFERLIASYMDEEKGYTSRRAVYEERWEQDYDLLARWGEWDRTDAAHPTKVHL
jgi:double-strand break repair protein AddB